MCFYINIIYFKKVAYFDDHTKLSADAEGMYFKLYMNGLEPGRYYKLLFKHNNNDGITVHDEDCYFKVVE